MRIQTPIKSKTELQAHELTLNEIGERMGLTRERVRQIEVKGLIKLRKQLSLKNLKSINQFI